MEAIKDNKDLEFILPRNAYITRLEIINGISFTPREIDVSACILSGRKIKKIALFLSITPKTVETHIRNIMQKLGCNSQEQIVNYIEKSNKYSEIKKHYRNLMMHNAFELVLKKIPILISKEKIAYSIIRNRLTGKTLNFVEHVSTHLKLAGFLLIEDEKYRTSSDRIEKDEFTNLGYIIYHSSSSVDEKNVSAYLNNLIEKNSKAIAILLSDDDFAPSLPAEFPNATFFIVSRETNYYRFFFEILKKLLPVNIDKDIAEFMNQYEAFLNSSSENPLDEKTPTGQRTNYVDLILHNIPKKIWISSTIILCFIISISTYGYIHGNKRITETASVESTNTSPVFRQNQNKGSITWNLPRQDHIFVGRKQLLNELHTKLFQGFSTNKNQDKEKGINTLAITTFAGLGGIGKTQLALQYAHHTQIPYTLKAWFYAENIQQLDSQYIEFAKSLGYRGEKPSIKTALPYVNEWLSKHPGWLLIYDNVNEYEEIKPYLPENGGSIILTTRHQNWPNGFNTLNIDVMTEQESIELIQTLIQRKILPKEKESVKELAKTLGYLPLALAQASAYIHQTQITITDYLDLYKNHEQTLLSDNTLPKGTSSLPVAIVWDINLDAIAEEANDKQESALALEILSVCAYLAPEKIPNHLLLTWIKDAYPKLFSPEIVLPKLIGQLWRYSMIHRDENGDISVHRLVQAVVRHQHKNPLKMKRLEYQPLTVTWYDSILKSAHAEFSRKTKILEDESRQKQLLPHLQMLFQHYKELWPNNSKFNLAAILNDIGSVFFLIGETKMAQSYYEKSLPILEQYYCKDHIEVAWMLDQLGKSYRRSGDAKQAKKLHESALKIKEQYYSKDQAEIARTLDELGNDYRYLGDAKQAKKLHERSLKIKEQYYCEDHIEVAWTLNQLGKVNRYLGDPKQAKMLHERSLKIKEQYYGKDHAEVARTLDELGNDNRYLGDAEKAKELHEEALKIKEQYYGKGHIEEAWTLDQLGNDYRYLGDTEKAKKLHEQSLRDKEQYYGKDHIEVAMTLDELGNDYRYLGNTEHAKELHERALKIKNQYYDNGHIEVAMTLSYLGSAYTDLHKPDLGKSFLEKALKIKETYYGMDNPALAETLMELRNACKSLKDPNQAQIHLKRALKIRQQYFGPDHHLTIEIQSAI